jgi:hypothetical protein
MLAGVVMGQEQKLSNSVIANGGGVTANENFQVVGTIGQPIVGITSNATNIHKSGFWQLAEVIVTSVETVEEETVPEDFQLHQNYPNPFNPTTTIQFALPKSSEVVLKLYDLLGREITTLVDDKLEPGEYKLQFEANGLPTGVYFYRIQAKNVDTGNYFIETRKFTLLK